MNVTSPKMLAQAVRHARKQRKLTQRETAESIGMNNQRFQSLRIILRGPA